MRIRRFASIALHFSLTAFLACSQSGSPVGPAEEISGTANAEPQEPSRPESAIADSGSEAPSGESEGGESPVVAETGGSESASGEIADIAEPSVNAAEDMPSSEDAPAGAPSVVDSVLAEVSPAGTEEPEAPAAGAGVGETDAAPEVPGASKAAIKEQEEEAASADSPAAAAIAAAPASPVFLATDFEGEDLSCWNGNRAANGVNRAGCGPYTSIGSAPFALSEGGIARSGRKAVSITYAKNEEAGGANVSFSSDSVNVRAYYYFEPGFDFGQGLKIGRVSSFNKAKQLNDVDIILEVRSAKSSNQCGVTDMRDVGVFFNGAPKGSDWGNATATMAFERGRWYAVEYQVVLNAPGKSDGIVRLWVDGKLVAERLNLPIRGSLDASAKLNVVKIGGWYSNGANGNSCANPSQPAKLHMDDVAIAASYIGT